MTYTIILFVTRNPALSPEEFKDHYENVHIPLAQRLCNGNWPFHFTRRWLQSQAERVGDMRSSTFDIGRRLNLPAPYLLVHRVTMGTLGVLCQLDARVSLRDIVNRWNPATFVDV